MTLEIFLGFIKGIHPIEIFKDDIEKEVKTYSKDSIERDIAYLHFDVDTKFILETTDICRLLDYYLNNELSSIELEYIFQCLNMSSADMTERCSEICFALCDAHLGYKITAENIEKAKKYIQGFSDKLDCN